MALTDPDSGVLESVSRLRSRYAYRFVKRAFDITFSIVVLVGLSWLFAIIAIAIRLEEPRGPVLFKQRRMGTDGREFTLYKFRSMVPGADGMIDSLMPYNEQTFPAFKIRKDPRVTKVGRVLRKVSFDELPQFVNVLLGHMSVVGPRPALPKEVASYNGRQRQRLLVKPGITCFWQTRMNRDSIGFDEWVELDLLYIRLCGVWTDAKLIIQTVGVVLAAQGV